MNMSTILLVSLCLFGVPRSPFWTSSRSLRRTLPDCLRGGEFCECLRSG